MHLFLSTVLPLVMSVFGLSKKRDYVANGDGTVTDVITGLMWQQSMGEAVTYWTAVNSAENVATGGYSDWRMPTMKELFSLILYSGQAYGADHVRFFIDDVFDQPLGNTSVEGGREVDAQTWSAHIYNGSVMNNSLTTAFGVNFVDGRVKAYPITLEKYARYVRGNDAYGINQFQDNGDGTISDIATGLMWMETNNNTGMDWQSALALADRFELAGYSDWRLPTIKELHSIVDYSKGQGQAAIDETFFQITQTTDMGGNPWYPFFWSSTTLLDGDQPGDQAAYQAFGRALGIIDDQVVDVHGAGAVRCDPKSGNREDYPGHYHGFQGDIQNVFNYVRLVRDISTDETTQSLNYPIVETGITVCYNDSHELDSCPTNGEAFYGQDGSFVDVDDAETGSGTSSNLLQILFVAFGLLVVITIGWLCFRYRWRLKGFQSVKDEPRNGGFQEELAKLDSPHPIF